MIGWMGKNDRAARAAHILAHFFDVVFQIETWNFQKENLKFTNLSFQRQSEDGTVNLLFSIYACFGGAPGSLLEVYFVKSIEHTLEGMIAK